MIINYNVSGSDRKQLVAAIAEHTGEKARYLGAPSFAYRVSRFTIDKNGSLDLGQEAIDEQTNQMLALLSEKGFSGEQDASNAPEETHTCISMPRSLFTDSALENLQHLLKAKGALIQKALGAEKLSVHIEDTKVCFPWFNRQAAPEEITAYNKFIEKLCEMARNQKRVIAKEKPVENEKYAFRCFLLRLGFIGSAYRRERKILLKNLTGSSAFKNGGISRDD